MTIEEIKSLSIKDYLENIAIHPAKVYGHYAMSRSPFRNEQTPSVKVDFKSNLWYDFGLSQGGSLIDLVMRLNQCSFSEALTLIERGKHEKVELGASSCSESITVASRLEVTGSYNLQHSSLIRYLQERAIDVNIASEYCREVHYRIGDRIYFAIGFPNISYGYALRNPYFKRCLPPSTVSYISKDTERINLFEGFIDFLSLLTMKPEERNASALVLNSICNVKKSKFFLSKYRQIDSYLDNDGRQTLEQLRQEGFLIKDCSSLYAGFKDVNESLCAKKSKSEHSAKLRKFGIKR